MGNKVRYLFGSTFIGYAISVFVSIIVVHKTFGGIWTSGGGPPPPYGYLKVTVDAPDSVKSAIQWSIGRDSGYPFGSWLFNNGDTVNMWSSNWQITFRPMAGWAMPAFGQVWIPGNATNTIFGSCSFVSLSGDYQGLFSEPSGPEYESTGFCEVFGGKGLTFTGKISSGGQRYPFSGSFDQSGNAWSTIPRAGASPLSIHLVAGEDTLTGEITDETWTATILAKRNTFDSRSNPARQAGKYTFAFLGGTNSATQPGGDSFGTMTVSRSGSVTLAATLSDGTRASQKTFLSKDRQCPFYIPLYSGKGFVFGWLQLEDPSDPPKVELYRDSNYAGRSLLLAQGDYDNYELQLMGLFYASAFTSDNGAGRSVKIPLGCAVTLYTNDYFYGTPFTKTTDSACFADDGITAISSIRVGTTVVLQPDFGTITWMKPADARAKHYPAGFTNQMQSFVSRYQSTNQVPVLEYNVGQGIFQNGNPSESITNEFSIDSRGRISGPNNLNLTIAGSGSFKGSAKNPLTGKAISFSGVLLQRQQFGRGFFLDGEQSGSVYFGP